MPKKFLLYLIILIAFSFKYSFSKDIKILAKLNEDIITNIDVEFEKNYLLFLNENLKKLNQKDINNIAKNSLIREKIKQKETKKFFDLNKNYGFEKDLIVNFYNKKKFSNKKDFLSHLKEKNISIKKIEKKLKIDTLWNQIIYNKFNKNVKIDKNYLKNKIIESYKNNKVYEYNLSEILFEKGKDENETFNKIKKSIKEIGFKNTANKLSISDSSNFGGEIGWVKGSQLSRIIREKIYNTKKGEFTDPIENSNGYLILKVNDKKEIKKEINLEVELKNLINFETNRQLSQFSMIYYKRLKRNTNIDEYK